MTGEEALARIRKSLQRSAEETPAAKSLIEKIRSGKATYQDTALYARWAATNLGLSLSHVVCDIDLSDRAAVCKALLLDQYEDINGFVDMVQAELDSSFGIHLAPQRAPFAAERADTIGQSLADTTKPDDVIRRRAQSATATATKAIHDDRMKAEACFRSRAGLKCYITRTAVGGCCPWCSDVAGRYEYGEEPDDIYRRHDNCDCTVTFENGRQRQDVWSKRTWEVPGKDAGASEPTVLSAEQAAEIEAKHQPTVLTNGTTSGKIKSTDIFRKDGDDPMFEVTGRAIDSNPQEVAEMISLLQEWGVKINRTESTLGYGGVIKGKPGTISITDNASYSAWRHEFDHVEQDRAAGWNGVVVLWTDPAERERREWSAYEIEIQLARDAGREDIVERLEANRDAEIKRIWHDYYERFGYPD
ncbi:MAG: hypothetical protein IIV23_04280 [Ruminococcus sp.]|nr:hypothetical protein [Ruminococcus sp.]